MRHLMLCIVHIVAIQNRNILFKKSNIHIELLSQIDFIQGITTLKYETSFLSISINVKILYNIFITKYFHHEKGIIFHPMLAKDANT